MKRFFLFSLVTMMFVATLTTSCSMQGMVFKNLEKKGYIVGRLTPAQQVAMAPLITIQLLGFKSVLTKKIRENIAVKRILNADDEQIIEFM